MYLDICIELLPWVSALVLGLFLGWWFRGLNGPPVGEMLDKGHLLSYYGECIEYQKDVGYITYINGRHETHQKLSDALTTYSEAENAQQTFRQ